MQTVSWAPTWTRLLKRRHFIGLFQNVVKKVNPTGVTASVKKQKRPPFGHKCRFLLSKKIPVDFPFNLVIVLKASSLLCSNYISITIRYINPSHCCMENIQEVQKQCIDCQSKKRFTIFSKLHSCCVLNISRRCTKRAIGDMGLRF